MTNPTNPEPGWYQDPMAPGSHRWWDGARWTDQVLAETSQGNGLSMPSDWFSEAIRLARSRAGHLFTIVALVAIPATVISGILSWLAIDGVVISNIGANADGLPEATGFDGASAAFGLASLAVTLIASALVAAAMAHQVSSNMAADASERDLAARRFAGGDQEVSRFEADAEQQAVDECPWSDSLGFVFRRAPKIMFVVLGPLIGFVIAFVVLLVLAAAVPPLALLFFLMVPLLAFLGVRLSLALSAASVGPSSVGSFRSSFGLTDGVFWPVLGRIILLAIAAFTIQIFSAFITAPITSGFSNSTFDANSTELVFRDLVGGNPAAYLASRVLGSLIGGVTTALTAAGMFIIYRERGGSLDPNLEPTHGRALRGAA